MVGRLRLVEKVYSILGRELRFVFELRGNGSSIGGSVSVFRLVRLDRRKLK